MFRKRKSIFVSLLLCFICQTLALLSMIKFHVSFFLTYIIAPDVYMLCSQHSERKRERESIRWPTSFILRFIQQFSRRHTVKGKRRAWTNNWMEYPIHGAHCHQCNSYKEFVEKNGKNTNKLIKVIGLLINVIFSRKKMWKKEEKKISNQFLLSNNEKTHPMEWNDTGYWGS